MGKVNWDDLRVFSAAAKMGSFRRAAGVLGMTEPTVSRRMRRFESDLKIKLFRHVGGAMRLTDGGRRILTFAEAAEYTITQMSDLAGTSDKTCGRCSLLIGEGLAAYWLPRFLPMFMDQHPRIELSVIATRDRYGTTPPMFDLRVQYGIAPQDDQVAVRLATVHFALFGTRDYFARNGEPSNIEDLAKHRLLGLVTEGGQDDVLASWLGVGQPLNLVSNVNSTLAELVRRSMGIAYLPTYAPLIDPNLAPVLTERNFKLPLHLVYDRAVGKRPPVRAMIEFLRTIVFNPARMPWFSEAFALPSPLWQGLYKACLQKD